MIKKTGLGPTDPMGWITATKASEKTERDDEESKPDESSEVPKFGSSELPKYKTYEVRLTVLMRKDQLDALNELEREIMSGRDKDHKGERITKNTIIRAYLDALSGLDLDAKNIVSEEDFLKRIEEALRTNSETTHKKRM